MSRIKGSIIDQLRSSTGCPIGARRARQIEKANACSRTGSRRPPTARAAELEITVEEARTLSRDLNSSVVRSRAVDACPTRPATSVL